MRDAGCGMQQEAGGFQNLCHAERSEFASAAEGPCQGYPYTTYSKGCHKDRRMFLPNGP